MMGKNTEVNIEVGTSKSSINQTPVPSLHPGFSCVVKRWR
jgi:hypothetical protein